MNDAFKMLPGLIVGCIAGAYMAAKYPDITIGMIFPLLLLLLTGIFLLDYTGRW